MCQGKDIFNILNIAQIFGITNSIMKHVKKRLTYKTGSVA